ncbi:hypothetical protein COSHB9_05460 [Companilactobacillus alimentarius]|uniref:Uncharacterized protein n=1 Tax=Companilactobacillus alimentarius DSM 20249 TaxID=1423720 RepID=A0A2K9HE79_9LACO|nr:hypothetical protein LA20249_00990 [Companilactobacillus alimentarius DSM 20249]GEO44267.1 hypothetical protein LAL01_04990 [Companilactobacillus alimentarius]
MQEAVFHLLYNALKYLIIFLISYVLICLLIAIFKTLIDWLIKKKGGTFKKNFLNNFLKILDPSKWIYLFY